MQTEQNKKRIWLIVRLGLFFLSLVFIGAVFWQFIHNERTLELYLRGEPELTLEVGAEYEEPGAIAQFSGRWQETEEVQVQLSGTVDTGKLGQQFVYYTARKDGFTEMACRTVTVVDTQAPVISLVSDPNHYTLIGGTYQEEGFTATDNYDGDITAKVQREEKDGVVYYTVSDSSGNTASVSRTIVYKDPIPPVITLHGSYVVVDAGNPYAEPGYKATDNCDGDITSKVKVTSNINTNVMGTYAVTYQVTDAYGNTASAKRTVYVMPSINENPAPSNGKVIYLTFDDGPSSHTGKLLDILKKYNAKATFFVVNTGYIDMITRAANEGHTVAIHTATHRFEKLYASDAAYYADLQKMQDIIKAKTGQTAMLLRFPGGSSNTISKNYSRGIMTRLTKSVQEKGFKYFDWNVDSMDAGGARNSTEVYLNVVRGIGNKTASVVLQHDTHGFSVNAVEQILLWGISNGYRFEALTKDSPGCHHGVYN